MEPALAMMSMPGCMMTLHILEPWFDMVSPIGVAWYCCVRNPCIVLLLPASDLVGLDDHEGLAHPHEVEAPGFGRLAGVQVALDPDLVRHADAHAGRPGHGGV